MLVLFLDPLVLCLAVWVVARSTGEYEFSTMFFIGLGVGLSAAVLDALVGGALGWGVLVLVLGLLVFLLMKYCYLTLQQALIVSGVFVVYKVLLGMLFQATLAR